ncbi:hypothetical protein PVAG01_05002 [Phlyctema vagabunda]|uniref:DUF8035 domain-containing protein n=1 Tax=Phlyctema vagabunda TaxID=108571 RepID=A0ABR4PIU9_9HELO
MSFGASPADIAAVVKFCRACYRKCKQASGEYLEISREVRGLHTVLRHLKYEAEAPESLLNRDQSMYGRELAPIIQNCDFTLRALENLIQKYGRLGDGSPSSPRVLWDKIKFGSNEMDELGDIRVKLISHKTSLTLFLDTIQLQQAGKVSSTLDTQSGQLDMILDKVDGIAARMCQRAGSIMTSYDDDDKEVWKQFRRELVAEGFDSAVLHKHKDVLRAYIREIDQQGLLEDDPRDPQKLSNSSGVSPERWLDSVHSETSGAPPPSFRSYDSTSTEDSMKQMVGREENIKFPQSIKAQRGLPDSKSVLPLRQVLSMPDQGAATEKSENEVRRTRTLPVVNQRQPSPVPRLVTSTSEALPDNDLSNSETDTEETGTRVPPESSSNSTDLALVIRTSDIVSGDSSMALQVMPSGSPSSFRSYNSFAAEDIPQTMSYRAKHPSDAGLVPPLGGLTIPVHAPSKDGRSSPRTSMGLAPDQNGNEIPSNARWTRIRRSLVSPEVLDQDHCRYEARPDFVAVLGVLTREQIIDYAARSQELRDARRRKTRQQPPPQPPRPVPIPIPRRDERPGRDTPADDYSDSSEDERQRNRDSRNSNYPSSPTSSYTHVNRSGYPNPYGVQPPPSPAMSSSSTLNPQTVRHPQNSPREARIHYSYDQQDRERKERHRHSSPPRQKGRTSSSHSKTGDKEKPKSRWKENMGAGAVGGAAMSLLHVLSEAAEGL